MPRKARPARPVQPAKAILVERGWAVSELAAAVGCSLPYMSRVLNGRENPSPILRAKVAELLELPADHLFADEDGEVVVRLVRRTTSASGVPEHLDDPAVIAQVARLLGDAR